ncbi:MAG: thiamine pyrophosphate-binding protein [Hyphomicrobiales bacterium]
MRHGGQLLVDQLAEEGCDTAFCVPGESYLAALDGLYGRQDIRTVICRQEGGAAMMAEAHAKMTGKLGAAFVTRGPGASNASIGVHIARQDSTPMILFVGQVGLGMEDREAFQEVDFKQMFSPLAKWAAEIRQTDRIPEYVARAAHTARSGRPGPVVLALPEDMLSARTDADTVAASPLAIAQPSDADIAAVSAAVTQAKRPLMLIGGPGWSGRTRDLVTAFAERLDLPVAATFRYQDYMDNRHPNYAGHMGIGIDAGLAKRILGADLLIVMGPRLGEMTTGAYSLVKPPTPEQKLIHIHPGAEELGSVYRTDVPVLSTLGAFAERLADIEAPASIPWKDWTRGARADFEAYARPVETPGAVKMEQIVSHISRTVPDDAIITNGAGNYAAFVHRYFTYRGYKTQLANTAGAMGYGIPSAVAAKLAAPERTVISFNGDGCFMMNGQELATAMQYDLPIIMLVVNNGMYGTIRMHQEREYPNRVSGTTLHNPDFAAYARSYGANGERIERTEDFPGVFAAALKSRKPTLIELKVDPQAITPTRTLDQIRSG